MRLISSDPMTGKRILAVVVSLAAALSAAQASAAETIRFAPVGTYATGLGEASAEIVAHDDGRAYVINTATTAVDILDVAADKRVDGHR